MALKHVTVFGGSGFLGRQIVKCLAVEGTNVRVAVCLSLSKTRFRVCKRENRGMILIDDWDLETDSGFLLRAFQIGSATGSREHLFEASA